jgi:hypothetical protein
MDFSRIATEAVNSMSEEEIGFAAVLRIGERTTQ